MITKEQIEQEAASYVEDISGLDYIGQAEAERAFFAGVIWRINSVWHDARHEVPTAFRSILVEQDDLSYSVNMVGGNMQSCPMAWEKFAYIDDLLPAGKEERL